MNKLKYIILIFTLFGLISCEDLIDQPPLTEVASDYYWTTTIDLRNYIYQFYSEFPGHGTGGEDQIYQGDIESDILMDDNSSDLLNGTRSPSTGTWTSQWANIRGLNIFFDNYSKCEEDFDQWGKYLGMAHFFKAWFYFELVKKYGDVPWINEPLYPDSEKKLMGSRDSRTLVVDSILANLDKAIMYLDARVIAGNNTLNKETVLAFKTRVALFEGTWQKYHKGTPFGTSGANPSKYFQACVSAGQELMNGDYTVGLYSTGDSDMDYFTLFGMDDMSKVNEVLFYRAYNASEGQGHNLPYFVRTYPAGIGLTWQFVTSYLNKNGEPFDYMALSQTAKGSDFLDAICAECDPRLDQCVVNADDLGNSIFLPPIDKTGNDLCSTGFQLRKYRNESAPGGTRKQAETGAIIFRYAEVLLNYAEAKYELDGTVAYNELNQLRARAGMPDFSVISQSSDPQMLDYGYSISDELYEIRRERCVETVGEGFREWDWKRWAAHILFKDKRMKGYPFKQEEYPKYSPLLDENGLVDYHQSELPNGLQFKSNRGYLDNIPLTEVVLNPNLGQNPGW